jgi:hypothetical protein
VGRTREGEFIKSHPRNRKKHTFVYQDNVCFFN